MDTDYDTEDDDRRTTGSGARDARGTDPDGGDATEGVNPGSGVEAGTAGAAPPAGIGPLPQAPGQPTN